MFGFWDQFLCSAQDFFFFLSFALQWTIRFCGVKQKKKTIFDETYYILLVERRTKQVLFFACQIFMRVFIRLSWCL